MCYLPFYINIYFKCHFYKHVSHLSLHISICFKCHSIQALVLTSYNHLCQISIHISICDAKCHVTSFNKILTCSMYKTLLILQIQIKLKLSTLTFNQITTIHHLINGRPYIFLHFVIKFLIIIIIIIIILFNFIYFCISYQHFSIHINNNRTILRRYSFYSFPLILILFLFTMQHYYIDDYYYDNIILNYTNISIIDTFI